MKTFNTACPRNCYSTCSFKVVVENDLIIEIEPQSLNKSTSEGPCLKGLSYLERVYSKNRILHPLRKTNGKFHPITWDEAFDTIANKLTDIKNDTGSYSVLYYAASGSAGLLNDISLDFWKLYGGVTTVYGNLCWPAGLEATRLTLGENKHNVPWDIENAKLIVLWGKNPAETNIHQMVFIEKAQKEGAKLVVIDPRRTPSSERADLLLQPIPGTDAILALAVAKLIIENNNHDQDFIESNVLGFDEFKKSLYKIDVYEASNICGIPMHLISKLAKLIGETNPMTLVPGYGMQRYSNGGQTVRCLLALSAITGNIGKKGACWHYANLQSYIFDKVKEPETYYPTNGDLPNRRSISTARLGKEMIATSNPKLKMAWVERGNPLSQNPDSNLTKKAFEELDFVVVVEQFMTDTAMEADIILPAKSMFEQSDIIGSYWNPYIQLKQKIIDPPGDVLPETEIYYHLAKKLGFSENEIKKYIPEPGDNNIDRWLADYLKDYDNLSMEKLKSGPVLAPGLDEIAFSDLMFNTPSGKIELLSSQAAEIWDVDKLPIYNKLDSSNNGKYPLHLMSPNTKNRIHSQFGNLECINMLDPVPMVTMSPVDSENRGVEEGEKVRVYNDFGEMSIVLNLDYSIRPGNVVIYNGYWNSEGGSPNLLSNGRETDIGHGAAFHDNMVNVEKIV